MVNRWTLHGTPSLSNNAVIHNISAHMHKSLFELPLSFNLQQAYICLTGKITGQSSSLVIFRTWNSFNVLLIVLKFPLGKKRLNILFQEVCILTYWYSSEAYFIFHVLYEDFWWFECCSRNKYHHQCFTISPEDRSFFQQLLY